MAAAKSALRYWERRQEVVANNLANVSTDGFKGERVFARLVADGMAVAQTMTDQRNGTLRQTGNTLDVGLASAGFLVVKTDHGERYTRGGALKIDPTNHLVDQNGNQVLADGGPVLIPSTVAGIEIDRTGIIRASPSADRLGRFDGERPILGRLRLEQPPAATPLAHEGDQYFIPAATTNPVAIADRDVRQGYVEDSNVTATDAMVEMITIQRHFAFAQKAITTLDDTRGRAVNDLGKPV
jgi:flagellar basal body rod protein FlgG